MEATAPSAGRKETEVKNSKWLLLAGLVIMMMTVGCQKQLGFAAPESDDVGIAATSTLPIQYNPGGSWFTYFNYMPPVAAPGVDYAMSIGNDAGGNGFVRVWNDLNNLYVEYNTLNGWKISQVHVAVALDLDGIPHNKSGNMTPGNFPYPPKTEFNVVPPSDVHLVTIPWDTDWNNPPDPGLFMVTHCIVFWVDPITGDTTWQTGTGADTGKPYKDVTLPADPVHLCLGSWPGAQWDWSFFMAEVSGIGPYPSGYNIWDGNWRGWCGDAYVEITVPWCGEVYLKSSLGPIPAAFNQDPVVWHRINYMLNHRLPDWEHNMWDFQTAAWALLGPIRPGLELSANAQAMYDDAMLNGGDFMPAPGQQVAVFVVPTAGQQEMGQPVFIQVDP